MASHCLDKPPEISYFLPKMIFEKVNQTFLPHHSMWFPSSSALSLPIGGETASTGTKKLRLHTEHPASS